MRISFLRTSFVRSVTWSPRRVTLRHAVPLASLVAVVALTGGAVTVSQEQTRQARTDLVGGGGQTVADGTQLAEVLGAERSAVFERASRGGLRVEAPSGVDRPAGRVPEPALKRAAPRTPDGSETPAGSRTAPPTTPTRAKAAAKAMVAARGWSSSQYSCLVSLWEKESNWKYRASNPSSGAYGIPQSLPGSKMASAGSDWRTNPATQIEWGLGYVADRYGTPCAAWSHSKAKNWY